MANQWLDALGTSLGKFRLGFLGPLFSPSSGVIEARNNTDSAYAAMRMAIANIVGDSIILNEQASSSGASWKMTLSRPGSGMTHDLEIIMPSADPTVGQALTVASFASNVITLQWTTIAAGTDKIVIDTTSIAFGVSSPVAMFTKPNTAVILSVELIIDTPFDGTPTLSVGISGTTSKYGPTTAWDLTAAIGGAKTGYVYHPNEPATTSEALIATYSAGGATVGAGRILVRYAIPS